LACFASNAATRSGLVAKRGRSWVPLRPYTLSPAGPRRSRARRRVASGLIVHERRLDRCARRPRRYAARKDGVTEHERDGGDLPARHAFAHGLGALACLRTAREREQEANADWDGNLFRLPRVLLEHYRVPELTVRLVRTNGHAGPEPQRPAA
jgi:hypothetical protein